MIENFFSNKNKIYILAEIGINHDGDINKAKELIKKAKECGADGIKLQLINTEKLIIEKIYQNNILIKNPLYDIFKKYELPYNDYKQLYYCSKELEIDFLCTIFDEEGLNFIDELVKAHKISSGDLTHIPLIKKVALKNKPIILSTGMADIDLIKQAINIIKNINNKPIILLHCNSIYPPEDEEINLNAILTLRKEFDTIVGFSDHSIGTTASIAACAMGARFIEKHITFDKKLKSADHQMSMEIDDFKVFIKEIRRLEKMFGSIDKKPSKREIEISKSAHRGVYTKRKILKDEIINESDIIIVRPKTNLPPKEFENIIGKKAKKDLEEYTPINPGDY